MTMTDILKEIQKNLNEERLEIAEDMVNGRVSDFGQYKRQVGKAEGLTLASNIIRDTIKELNK